MQTTAIGIGVDMVSIRQLDAMLATGGAGFRELCWTPDELNYCGASTQRLAARWAAKEAVMKALGHGIGEIAPTDIEVIGQEGHPPSVQLRGPALAMMEERQVDLALSMSHEADLAIAFVVAVPRWAGAREACQVEDGPLGTE